MTLGEYLRKKRIEAGYKSQRALAAKMKTSPARVSNWENNIFVPNNDNLMKLHRLVGLNLSELSSMYSRR